MVYKFNDESIGNVLEVEKHPQVKGMIRISINNSNTNEDFNFLDIELCDDGLYDLIGALHSIQAKIKKEVSNG